MKTNINDSQAIKEILALKLTWYKRLYYYLTTR
jgi:hypothetical protein